MRTARRRTAVVLLASLSLVLSSLSSVMGAERRGPPEVGTDQLARDSWIVTLVPGADPAVEAPGLARAAGGRAGLVYRHAVNGFQFVGSGVAAEALERSPRIVSVEPDRPVFLTETLPYGVERVYAYDPSGSNDGAYQNGFRGAGARIAVLDTGIDLDHPDLAASVDHGLGLNCLDATSPPADGYGHGTHVAGTAAAPRNSVGVVGVAPEARLVAVKMFDDAGNSAESLALCALDHIVRLNTDADPGNDIDVANMSWTEARAWGDCDSDALHGAICRADAAGIILIAGAGNSAVNAANNVPAAYPEVLSVSALADFDGQRGGLAGCGFVPELFWLECDDSFAFFSNYGASVDVIAPGVQVQSTWTGDTYRTSSGTSMATPHVAGIAAVVAAAAPGISPADARAALLGSGECPNGQPALADGLAGCQGQGTWPDDPDGTPEPMGDALRAAQAVTSPPPPPPGPAAPSAPVLSAVQGDGSVELSWTTPQDDGGAPITAYEVYRGPSAGSATLLATIGPDVSYTDSGLTNGTTYWYQVAAVNSAGVGTRSNEVAATPATTPSAPSLVAIAGDAMVSLSWSPPGDDGGAPVTGYEVYRGLSVGSATLLATIGAELSYTDTGLTNGTTYWYQVAAVNGAGVGDPSAEASATPQSAPTVPSAPLDLTSQKLRDGIRLTWSPPASDGGAVLSEYVIRRSGGSGPAEIRVDASVVSLVDGSVEARTWYTYTVSAVNGLGEGPPSNDVRVRSR